MLRWHPEMLFACLHPVEMRIFKATWVLSPKPNIRSIPIWDERIKPNANMKSIDETKPASIKITANIYV